MAQNQSGASGAPNRQGGPASYAVQTAAPVQSTGGGYTYQPVRAGISGVGTATPTQAAGGDFVSGIAESQKTVNRLLELGQDILKPHLERAEQQAYFNGINKVVQGQTLAEISAEKPWYTRIFGDGAMIEGARAYTVEAAVNEQALAFQQKMPELRKLGTDQVSQQVLDGFMQAQTGDPAADAALLQAATKALPGLLQQHTRQHVAWVQEENVKGQFKAGTAAGALVKELALKRAQGFATDADVEAAIDATVMAVTPPDGQDDGSYDLSLAHIAQNFLATGNLQAYNGLADRGLIQRLPPDAQIAMQGGFRQAEARVKGEIIAGPMAKDVANLQVMLSTKGADQQAIVAAVTSLNEHAAKTYGLSTPLIDLQESLVRGQTVLARNEEQLTNATRTLEQKKAIQEQKEALTMGQFLAGLGDGAGAGMDLDADAKSVIFQRAAATLETPDQKMDFVVANAARRYVDKTMSSAIHASKTAVLGGTYSAAADAAHSEWAHMYHRPGGPTAAAMYFGADFSAQMKEYDTLLARQPTTEDGKPAYPQVAYEQVFSKTAQMKPPADVGAADYKKLESAVADSPLFGAGLFGWGNDLNARNQRNIARLLAPEYEAAKRFNQSGSPAEWAEAAVAAGVRNGVETVGPFAYRRDPNERPIDDLLPGREIREETFETVLKAKLAEQGLSDKNLVLHRLDDVEGKARWVGLSPNGGQDGGDAFFFLDQDDLLPEYEKRKAGKIVKEEPRKLPNTKHNPFGRH